tara:strand:- start:2429 stop:3538 length:1110 start_codon:yes stop_codon:yes gene_type:complete
MSEIRVNTIKSEDGTQPIAFNKGINVTGVVTASSYSGTITATGLTGTPDIAVQNITGVAATFSGAVTYEDVVNIDSIGIVTARSGLEVGAAGVGGTISATGNVEFAGITTIGLGLTFADNIEAKFGDAGDLRVEHNGTNSRVVNNTGELRVESDTIRFRDANDGDTYCDMIHDGAVNLYHDNSVKLATSATGVTVTGQLVGVTTGGTASGSTVGVGTTATILGVADGATHNRFSGVLVEKSSIVATNIANAVGTIDLAQGNVHYFTTNGSGATAADIIYKGGNNLSAFMKVGENISVSLISKPNNSEYVSSVTIDGSAVTEYWSGGTPSSASGAASTFTITTINITRFAATGTPNSDYLVLCAATNYET